MAEFTEEQKQEFLKSKDDLISNIEKIRATRDWIGPLYEQTFPEWRPQHDEWRVDVYTRVEGRQVRIDVRVDPDKDLGEQFDEEFSWTVQWYKDNACKREDRG